MSACDKDFDFLSTKLLLICKSFYIKDLIKKY